MRDSDKPRFSAALGWLAKKYPFGRDGNAQPIPRKLADIGIDDYFEALRDLSVEQIERGCKWHYAHSEFFPERPAALRKSVEAAPVPPRPALTMAEAAKQLPEKITPPEESRRRLREMLDGLYAKFGPSARVKKG
jgi:hypothetical protein